MRTLIVTGEELELASNNCANLIYFYILSTFGFVCYYCMKGVQMSFQNTVKRATVKA